MGISQKEFIADLGQWCAKNGSQTSSINWEFVRNANSQVPPRPAESETLSIGPSLLGDSEAHLGLRTTDLEKQWLGWEVGD